MKHLLLAILSGLLFAFAWPTYGLPVLLFTSFIPLLYIEYDIRLNINKKKKIRLFIFSYLSFFIWNFITTSWLRFADLFGAAFAVLVNSLLMTLVFMLYHSASKRTTRTRSLVFLATLWISFEFLHLNWEFSWPWLNLGNAFSEYYTWIQWYEYTGTFGGTFWILIINILIFNVLHKNNFIIKNINWKASIPIFLLILVPIIFSYLIYLNHESDGENIDIVLLQPNIDPYSTKYNMSNSQVSDLFIGLSNTRITGSTDFVIAPETVFAQNVRLDQFETSLFKYKLDKYVEQNPNLNLLTGISFVEFITNEKYVKAETNFLRDSVWYNDFNSAVLLNSTGKEQIYHKSKLVVGIENFPYQEILKPLIGDVMIDLGGTVAMKTTQKERSTLNSTSDEFRAAPIICYESVYGEFVTGYVRNGANFLAIITNDAWWNDTQGHKQHLSYARLRAIETRRHIARSANTGISALIDDRGAIMQSLEYNKQGALSGTIKTNEAITFYVIAGDYIARISVFVMLLLGLIIFFRKPIIRK